MAEGKLRLAEEIHESRKKENIFTTLTLPLCRTGKKDFRCEICHCEGTKRTEKFELIFVLFIFILINSIYLSRTRWDSRLSEWEWNAKRKTFSQLGEKIPEFFFHLHSCSSSSSYRIKNKKGAKSSRCVIKQHKSSSIHLTLCLKLIIAVIHIFFLLLLRKAFVGCRILSWIMQWKDISRWRKRARRKKRQTNFFTSMRNERSRWEERKTLDIFFLLKHKLGWLVIKWNLFPSRLLALV